MMSDNNKTQPLLKFNKNGQWELVKAEPPTLDYSKFNKPKKESKDQYTLDYSGSKPKASGTAWSSKDTAGGTPKSSKGMDHSKTGLKETRIDRAVSAGKVIDDRPKKVNSMLRQDRPLSSTKKSEDEKPFSQRLKDIKEKYRDEFKAKESDPAKTNTKLSIKDMKKQEQ